MTSLALGQVVTNDKWTVVEKTVDGSTQFIRFRYEFTRDMDLESHPEGIHIFWDFKPNAQGMPKDSGITTMMEDFENKIVQELETDLSGILVSVLTLDGYRHWTFCVKSIEVFLDKLNSIPQSGEPYPIELEKADGSGWKYLFENIYQYKENA